MAERTFQGVIVGGLVLLLGVAGLQLSEPARLRHRAASRGWRSAELTVPEMGCAACRVAIVDALHRLDGVGEIATERRGAAIAYDPARVSPERMVRAIEQAGYHASFKEPPGH